jgi:hypothetical protein
MGAQISAPTLSLLRRSGQAYARRHVQRELHGDSGRFTPRAIALATGSGLLGLLLLVGLVALGTERNPSDAVLQAPASSPSMQPTSARSTPPPKRARVPAGEGFGLAKAKRKLRAAGLEVGDVDRRPSIKRRCTVLKQGVDTLRAFPSRRTMTAVVAQATDPSTADRSVSRVPTRTTWTETVTVTVTEKHASGRDQDAHPGLAVISG